MFDEHQPDDHVRRFGQEDILAKSIRLALAAAGPVGALIGEFLTEFVPQQRVDRLHDFVERLAERMHGLEAEFSDRMRRSPPFASLVEDGALVAVRSASDRLRDDVAVLLARGVSRSEADLHEDAALLRLRSRLADLQVVLLMSYGNFRRTLNDAALQAFQAQHPGLFDIPDPTIAASDDDMRRRTVVLHYEAELASLGLLRDTEGVVKSSGLPKYEITDLGRLLLQSIGRFDDPWQ